MDWEIYDGVSQRGPMPEAEVCEAIRAGLPRNAYVRPRGTSDWVPIDGHPPFAAALQARGAPGAWQSRPPPPPPPALVGAPAPPAPEVARPPPGTAYAVASPHAGKPTKRHFAGGGCLVQALGGLLATAAGVAPLAGLEVPAVVVAAVSGLGFVLIFAGGLLGLRWVCGQCRQPVARSVHFCPSCHASFT